MTSDKVRFAETARNSEASARVGDLGAPIDRSAQRSSEIDLTAMESSDDVAPIAAIRAALADGLERRLSEIDADVWAAIRSQVPAYNLLSQDPGDAEDLRESVRVIARVFVELVRADRPFSADELTVMRELGMRRAEAGFVEDDIRHAAHAALKTSLRHLLTEIEALDRPRASTRIYAVLSEQLHDHINEFVHATTLGIRDVQERRADETIEVTGQILDGTIADPAEIQQTTATVGDPLTAPCTLFVVAPARMDRPNALTGPVLQFTRDRSGLLRGPIRSRPVPHVAAVALNDGRANTGEVLRRATALAASSGLLVVSEHITALTDLAPTYQWIRELLGVPVSDRPHGLLEIEDLTPHWIADRIPPGPDFLFVQRTLGPLLASDTDTRERVLRVARAYLAADGSTKEAAEALEVHRKTIERGLADFESLTGRSLREPTQQLGVQLALRLIELPRATLPPPGAPVWNGEPAR